MNYQIKTLATHSSNYHLDDVMAAAILTTIYPAAKLIRSRDPTVLETADIVFDVGGGKYDHHFIGAEKRDNGITYSACGLVWRDFGRDYLAALEVMPAYIDDLWNEWDRIICRVDAHDNGEATVSRDEMSIEGIVGTMNIDTPFETVMEFVRMFMASKTKNMMRYHHDRNRIKHACEQQAGSVVIELPERLIWQSALAEFSPDALFVIFREQHQWRINAVPVTPGSFESKCGLYSAFRGLPKTELRKLSGLTLNFVHASGFTAAGDTKEDMLALVKLTLENS